MPNNKLTIAGTPVGTAEAPYVIAEAGSNFNQSLDTARTMIDVAADAGANAVKFQLFRANFLYPDGGELYDIFKSIELNPDWIPELEQHARNCGLDFMASAFDGQSVDVLEMAGAAAHKIASSETANLQFVRYVASKGRPVIISTGMCDFVDVEEALNACLSAGNDQVALMQCGAMYPLPTELVNLRVIASFAKRFDCPVGLSDHTLGQTAAITAVGLGASIFEKHYTLDRSSEGPDHFYALEPEELKNYISAIHEAYLCLGSPQKELLPKERELGRREGLYFGRNMSIGEVLTKADLVIKRPAVGLRARYAPVVEGASLSVAVTKDQAVTWDNLDFVS